MNKVNLVGRLTRDPELTTFQEDKKVCRFSIAVNRNYKNKDGEVEADYPSIVAWDSKADLCSKYFVKGDMIAITGRLKTGSYEANDGTVRYTTDVEVEDITFVTSKRNSSEANAVVDEEDDELPI